MCGDGSSLFSILRKIVIARGASADGCSRVVSAQRKVVESDRINKEYIAKTRQHLSSLPLLSSSHTGKCAILGRID